MIPLIPDLQSEDSRTNSASVLMSAILMGTQNRFSERPARPTPTYRDSLFGDFTATSGEIPRSWNVIFWWAVGKYRLSGNRKSDNSRNQTMTRFLSTCRCKTHWTQWWIIFGKENCCIILLEMLCASFFLNQTRIGGEEAAILCPLHRRLFAAKQDGPCQSFGEGMDA